MRGLPRTSRSCILSSLSPKDHKAETRRGKWVPTKAIRRRLWLPRVKINWRKLQKLNRRKVMIRLNNSAKDNKREINFKNREKKKWTKKRHWTTKSWRDSWVRKGKPVLFKSLLKGKKSRRKAWKPEWKLRGIASKVASLRRKLLAREHSRTDSLGSERRRPSTWSKSPTALRKPKRMKRKKKSSTSKTLILSKTSSSNKVKKSWVCRRSKTLVSRITIRRLGRRRKRTIVLRISTK